MRRIIVMLVAAVMIASLPMAAFAQIDEEALAAAVLLKEKADAIPGGADAQHFTDALADLVTTLAVVKAKAPDLDYAALDAAIADLHTAITGGDVAEMEVAAAAVAAAAAAVEAEAQAEAAADDGTEAPTAVSTGGPLPTGPNVALLGLAGILALLAGGALALRSRTVDRR